MKYDVEVDMSTGTSHSLILSRINPHSKVLEFGPATGYMTKYMKEVLSCSVYGVEIDEEAAKYAEQYTEKLIVGDIEGLDWYETLKEERFDYILFADVLEHLRNPSHILKLVVSLLKDDGRIITSVPNIAHNAIIMELLQGKFEYRPTGLLDETHIKFFTRNNVLKMLEYAGLSPVEWLVTQRRPETTEFKQDYRYFPQEVRKYLQSRPDGDVYQFVTVSCKSDFFTNGFDYNLQHTNYLDSDYIQVFWGSKANFTELNSIRTVHQPSDDIINYTLEFPPGAHGHIRIDPASRLVWGELHSIKVYQKENNSTSYLWKKERDAFNFHDISYFSKSDYLKFIGRSNDPWLIINNFVLEESEGIWCIEIQMRIKNDMEYMLNLLLNDFEDASLLKMNLQKEIEINEERNKRILQLEEKIAQYELKASKKLESIYTSIKDQNDIHMQISKSTAELQYQYKNISEQQNQIYKHINEASSNLISQQVELINITRSLTKPNIIKRIYNKMFK